jgi:serine/threonine-protein kinase
MNDASLIGTTIGERYRLLDVVGDGGMGRVFRAERVDTRETVALKLLHPQFSGVDGVVQRFEREAEVTKQLSHPNIVRVVEFGNWKGRLFLATEFLAGKSLADLLDGDDPRKANPMAVKRTLAIMSPVLEALEYAHGRGVVHRDLKPENIMVVPPGGPLSGETVKLLDFGVAKLGDGQSKGPKLTQGGLLLGTPGYMSPEQAVGQPADARSDLYSCGVILYEMLSGRQPFESESSLQVLSMHVNSTPKPLRAVAVSADVSTAVETAVMRALAKRPAERFSSARELREALERAARAPAEIVSGMEKTILAAPRVNRAPAPRASRRRRLRVGAAIIATAAAVWLGDHLWQRAAARTHSASDAGDARVTPPSPPTQASPVAAGRETRHNGKHIRAKPKSKRP